MKKQSFHVGSFLIGLLVGAVVLVSLAVSASPQSEAKTNDLLRKKTGQFEVSATQSVKKVTIQVQDEIPAFFQRNFQSVSRWFSQTWKGLTTSVHASASPICSGLSWLNQAQEHFLAQLGIHSQPWRLQSCAPV
jgi:gas vesicle protein